MSMLGGPPLDVMPPLPAHKPQPVHGPQDLPGEPRVRDGHRHLPGHSGGLDGDREGIPRPLQHPPRGHLRCGGGGGGAVICKNLFPSGPKFNKIM